MTKADQVLFGILNFGHGCLFEICFLGFGILIMQT